MLPTNGFSMKPLKVKLLAGEQKATEVCGSVFHAWGTNKDETTDFIIFSWGCFCDPVVRVLKPYTIIRCRG